MDLLKIINFLKDNYTYNADEIYECLGLLTDTLDSALVAIQHSSTDAFVKRDFEKNKAYADMAIAINNVQEKVKEYMNQLSVNIPDEAVSDDGEEAEDFNEQQQEETEPGAEEDTVKPIDEDQYKTDSSIKHSLQEDFTYKKPAAFEMDSVRVEVRDWRDLFFLTCEALVRKNRSIFESFISDPSMNGRRVKYFSRTRRGMTSPKKLPGTDIYVSMLGANSAKSLISKMLRKYNMDVDKYYVYISEDYSSFLRK